MPSTKTTRTLSAAEYAATQKQWETALRLGDGRTERRLYLRLREANRADALARRADLTATINTLRAWVG